MTKKRKALGQHFLKDKKALYRIVSLIDPQPEETLIEIGPGRGALTFLLTPKAGNVFAVEIDSHLASLLKERAHALNNLHIIEEDILKISFENFLPSNTQIKLVGNLPYSISTPILFKVMEEQSFFSECHFLLQKEVAKRICALPGSKAYAPLSIYFSNFFSTKLHFKLGPAAFSPPPKVDSAFISLIKREAPLFPLSNAQEFLQFLKKAFRHRRKTITNNFLLADFPPSRIKEVLILCKIEKQLRPEQIHLDQFVLLFKHLKT